MPDIWESARAAIYRFGVFELDARTRELRKHGLRIKLQEQPTQILCLLLEHPGEVVTREQIQKHLWPDNTFVDFDNAINSAVRKLREALGDTVENPRFVETLARRGYRFVATVSREAEKALSSEAPPPVAVRTRRKWASAVLLAILAALISVWPFRQPSRTGSPDIRFAPLTTYPGNQRQPSFSPDGTQVAFSWDGPDRPNEDIYVKMIGPSDPIRLTTDPARDFNPAWSPDGRWIAALRDMGGELAVLLIPVSGAPLHEVTRIEGEDPGSGTCSSLACYLESTLAWSPDGDFLFTASRSGRDSSLAIVRINVETGEEQPITAPPRGAADLDPAVAPDGRALAFLRTSGFANRDIWVVSLTAGTPSGAVPKRLTSDGADTRPPVWTPNGRELIFSSDRRGRHELWRLPVSRAGTPVRLDGMGGDAIRVAVSPRGERLVYEQETSSFSLWKIFIGSSERAQPLRVTSTTKADIFPHYSPDGRRIVFQSDRSGVNEIWVCDGDGANAMQLTAFGKGWSGSPRWSPDGRSIAFDSNVQGNWDIWAIRAEGGRAVQLTRNPAQDVIPRWSHRGDWIYFTSRRTGQAEIWKMRADGSSEKQVTNGGGLVAIESPDGRYLYYRGVGNDPREGPLWRMPNEGGHATKVIDSLRGRTFTPTERGVFFPAGLVSAELRFLDFATGAVRTIAALETPDADAVVSADGRWALYSRVEHASTTLILAEGFR